MHIMAPDPYDSVQATILEAVSLLKNHQGQSVVARIKPLLTQFPSHPRLHHVLGLALDQCGDITAALHHVSRAITLEPDQVEPYRSLALLLKKKGKTWAAEARIKDALTLQPNHPDLHFILGDLYMDQGVMDQAVAGFSQAITHKPDFLSAWINLGLCHKAMGQLDRARHCFEHALTIDSQNPQGHVNLALTLLLLGDYERGFSEFEWRFHLPEGNGLPAPPPAATPRWNGEPLQGKKLLVLAEQGYGDAIQFARFLPRLRAMGAETLTTIAAPLEALFRGQPGFGAVQSTTRWEGDFDYFIPMMSLGRFFARTPDQRISTVPYLFADPEQSRYWHQRLPRDRFRIGLVWEGKPLHGNDPLRRRSTRLETLAPLAQAGNRHVFISLQKDAPREQLQQPPQHMTILDLGPQLHHFADTAAVMEHLDLVITIDTATAHLAGAMGKPVWILLPMAPDWRWTMDRSTSPWYPTSKLYRQTRPNHWEDPVAQMVIDLKNLP